MKRRARAGVAALLLVALFAGLYAVSRMPGVDRPLARGGSPPARDLGTAKRLRGVVCVYHLFLEDGESRWSEAEQAGVLERVQRGQRFLLEHARAAGVSLRFVNQTARATFPGTIPVNALSQRNWTETAVESAPGQRHARALAEHLRAEAKAEQVVVLLHVNKPGVSYAESRHVHHSGPWIERTVCYARSSEVGNVTTPATYTHEMLHLFGAVDLYPYSEADAQRTALARKLYPRDLMLVNTADIDQLTVGAYTAYRIGWSDTIPAGAEPLED